MRGRSGTSCTTPLHSTPRSAGGRLHLSDFANLHLPADKQQTDRAVICQARLNVKFTHTTRQDMPYDGCRIHRPPEPGGCYLVCGTCRFLNTCPWWDLVESQP